MANKYANFFQLQGQTITKLDVGDCCNIVTDKGEYSILHYQDCCESVGLHSTRGDINDVLNEVITLAEDDHEGPNGVNYDGGQSHTWSRYRLETKKGYFEMYFLGESNGYYGESMSFEKTK